MWLTTILISVIALRTNVIVDIIITKIVIKQTDFTIEIKSFK
jgi:hypothetical protein